MARYINPYPQHTDDNGNPIAQFVVFFGEPNQDPKLNPKQPFSDAALTVAIAATQILDNEAGYGIDIFLSGLYSIRIESPTGSLYRETPSFGGILSLNDLGELDSVETDLKGFNTGSLIGGEQVVCAGYFVPGDGGGGRFFWDATSGDPDDNGFTIQPSGHVGVGRFKRIVEDESIYLEFFGAKTGIDIEPVIVSASAVAGSLGFILSQVNKSVSYTILSQTTMTPCDCHGLTLTRGAAYVTDEDAIILTGTGAELSRWVQCDFIDESDLGTLTAAMLRPSSLGEFAFREGSARTNSLLIDADTCDHISITGNDFRERTAGGSLARLLNLSNTDWVKVDQNYFEGVLGCAGIEGSTGTGRFASFNGNWVNGTLDTVAFIRAVPSSGAAFRFEMMACDNIIGNAGKAAIKFSIPDVGGANIAEVRRAVASGNIVRGWGLLIDSPAIAVFAAFGNANHSIKNIVITDNIIDGREIDGTQVTRTLDMAAISVRNGSHVVIANNQTLFTPEEGIQLNSAAGRCRYVRIVNNDVRSACLSAGEGGIALTEVENFVVDSSVSDTGSSKSGLFLSKAQQGNVSGHYNDNGNYGIEELSSGGDPAWSNFICYAGVHASGNTTGDISYAGGTDSVELPGSFDSNGPRSFGTATRRGNITLRNNGNQGFMYFNETTGIPNWWNGTAWVDATGAVV